MTGDIPVLAIMGHPNAGKSSVVATLTENDRIEIDKRAGTTTRSDEYPVIIDGQTIMEFIDTPGFQNPTDILEWFQSHQDEIDLAGAFVAAHRDDPLFSHDRALLEPISRGRGSSWWWMGPSASRRKTAPRWSCCGSPAARAWPSSTT